MKAFVKLSSVEQQEFKTSFSLVARGSSEVGVLVWIKSTAARLVFLAGYTCFPPCASLPLCLEQRALNNSWWLEGTACATLLISPSSQPDCYCSSLEQEGFCNAIKLWETVAVTVRVWLHATWSKMFKERRCLPVSTLYCKAYVYTQTLTCTCIREEVCVSMGGNPACTKVNDRNSHWPWQGRAPATACACGGVLCKRSGTLRAQFLYSWGMAARVMLAKH